ncbi:MAG: selenocysteine-specific translation elongation factor, partial [Planctomycetes bacterium RBG_13_63_9]
MASEQVNITLGTAGHIDHGKTALIRCLTGCETDRLKAEKERGMSIDLGFAPCTIADIEVGIVDVPGHENFVRTMVAGASGMDGVILVVAADDGVMPQTREHLDILTLLGIRHGLVVLTKIDRVEPERIETARAELVDFFQGTFLEGAPILPVSNVTGEGFSAFYESLAALAGAIEPKRLDGVFRLPIDRAFSAKGYGTIVAGIPVSGSARIGDEVVLMPHDLSGRIRHVQVYGRDSDTVKAGQCAALNVTQWDQGSIRRGHTAATPGYFAPRALYACTLRLLPRERLGLRTQGGVALKSGARVKLHTGTSEAIATVYAMEAARVEPAEEVLVQVRTDEPVIAAPGDRYVLRSLSPVQTIGGGTIIEALSKRLKRSREGVCQDLQQRAAAVRDDKEFVRYCLRTADAMVADEGQLALRAKLPRDRVKA